MRKKGVYLAGVLLLLTGTFLGCGSKTKTVKLADTVSQIQGMENYEPSGDLAQAFQQDVVYKVKKVKWDGDTGTASVIVTTPDLENIISDSIQSVVNGNESEDSNVLLEKAKDNIQIVLASEKYPTIEKEIEMDAEKTEDSYTLISNDDFQKAVSGNLEAVFIHILKEGLADETKD